MKKYIITGLLIWIPLVITLWVLKLIVDSLDHVLLLLPPEFRTENWLGIHVPGHGRGDDAGDRAGHRPVRHQPHRRAPGALLARDPAPHPGGQLDLFQRQADLRHAVLLQRPGVPQGAAGAVAAPGHVDHRFPHRTAGRRRRQSPAGRLRQRLRADHAQPDRRLLRDGRAQGRHRARHERGRGAEVHHLDGRGPAGQQATE